MELLHLEYNGKTAKLPVRSLPAKIKPQITYKTSVGKLSSVLLKSGINPFLKADSINFQDIIDKDDEIVLDGIGESVERETLSTAYYDPRNPRPETGFEFVDVIYGSDGVEKQRRPHLMRSANINTLNPIKITKRLSTMEAFTSFVFKQTHQIVHEDGLMRDFLFGLAQDLYQSQTIAVLGAGPKGNQPLIVRDKGNPYRAFLYGAIGTGDNEGAYKLLLLLSDQELKLPEA